MLIFNIDEEDDQQGQPWLESMDRAEEIKKKKIKMPWDENTFDWSARMRTWGTSSF